MFQILKNTFLKCKSVCVTAKDIIRDAHTYYYLGTPDRNGSLPFLAILLVWVLWTWSFFASADVDMHGVPYDFWDNLSLSVFLGGVVTFVTFIILMWPAAGFILLLYFIYDIPRIIRCIRKAWRENVKGVPHEPYFDYSKI